MWLQSPVSAARALVRMATLGVVASGVSASPPEVPPQHAMAPDAVSDFDAFGAAVAMDADRCVVGARGLDEGGVNRGGAWVLAASDAEWVPVQRLVPELASEGDQFGAAVAVSGDRVFVGPLDWDEASGAASAFVAIFDGSTGTWSELGTLDSPVEPGAGFGSVLAADGDRIVVGAPLADLGVRDEGAVFVYRLDGVSGVFELEATLVAPDSFENDQFGASVAISGDSIVVGVPRDDDTGVDGGAVWVFELGGGAWQPAAKIIRDTSDWYAGFGSAVAIDGSLLAVGAPRDGLGGAADGAVRAYRRVDAATWVLEAAIVAEGDPSSGREFGDAVALDGDRLVIGVPADSQMGSQAGAAVTWRRIGASWVAESAVRADEVTGLALLGAAVAADGGRVLLGVPVSSAFGQYAGGLASLDLRADCDADGVPDYIVVAAGIEPDCNANGQPDACDLVQGLDDDCNSNGVPDGCELADGTELDCDADGVLDSCQIAGGSASDCNQNGLIDDCEIEDGTADDCDQNGVIDACELADGSAEDCDENGAIDSCEIADGTAEDLDRDGVVDACQAFLVFEVPARFDSIAKAVGLAPAGSVIALGPGTYSEAVDFLGKAITIEGDAGDPGSVVLDGTGLADTSVVKAVSGEGADSVLRGVTVTNGTSGTIFGSIMVGGAVYTRLSSPTVEDCVFESNAAQYGGAVYAWQGSPTFRRCVFRENAAEFDGGGFQFSRTVGGLLDSCDFDGNTAGNNGGAVHLFGGMPTIVACSLDGNSAANGGGGVSWSTTGDSAAIVDTAIGGNAAAIGGGIWIAGEAADLVISESTVCENEPDQLIGEYVDAGGNQICPNVDCNLNGLEDADEIADGSVSDCNENGVIDDCEIEDGTASDVNLDGILDECQDVLKFSVPGSFSTIGSAIAVAPEGSIISVAAGLYHEAVDLGDRNLTIQGDPLDPASVVLDGAGIASSVVTIAGGQGEATRLIGLTIRNGAIGSPMPGQPVNRVGGALFIDGASPVVMDCAFTGNTSGFGGAVYLRGGAPVFAACSFALNEATADGGAIYGVAGGGRFEGCVIEANSASNHGGGVKFVLGAFELVGCDLSGNTGYQGGGLYWFADESATPLRVSGCSITGNDAIESGGGIKARFGFPGVSLESTIVCDNLPDEIDGAFTDDGGNELCICVADLSGDGLVGGADLGLLLVSMGPCAPGVECAADLNGDGEVSGADLGLLLAAWGACP